VLCRQVEKAAFHHPKVREIFQNFVVAKLYVDEKNGPDAAAIAKRNQELEIELAGSAQQPAYVIMEPQSGRVISTWGFEQQFISDPPTFGERLEQGLATVRVLQGN